jgi:hypothetical protein
MNVIGWIVDLYGFVWLLSLAATLLGFIVWPLQRRFASVLSLGASLCSLFTVVWSLLLLAYVGHTWMVVLGLFLGIVGVVPILAILFLVQGEWTHFASIVLMVGGIAVLQVISNFFGRER